MAMPELCVTEGSQMPLQGNGIFVTFVFFLVLSFKYNIK
jgi:hypothetical protein